HVVPIFMQQRSITSIGSRSRLQPRHDKAIIFAKLVRLLDGTICALVKLCQLGAQSAFHHPSSPHIDKNSLKFYGLTVNYPSKLPLFRAGCGPRLSCFSGITAVSTGSCPPMWSRYAEMAARRRTAHHVRRDKAALFQWVQCPPGDRSRRKQPGQAWR